MTDGSVRRDFAVVSYTPGNFSLISRLEVHGAFIRDVSVSAFDAASQAVGSITLILVPSSIEAGSGGGAINTVNSPLFRENLFSFEVAGQPLQHVAAVSSLHVSFGKIADMPMGNYRQYLPGQPVFDSLQLEVASGSTSATYLQTWVSSVAGGNPRRDGAITLLNQASSPFGHISLFEMIPITFHPFSTSPNRRTLFLEVGRFEVSVP